MLEEKTIHKNLHKHVQHLSTTIGERHLWQNGSLDDAADYIDAVFRENHFAVKHQRFSCYGKTVANLIAEKKGRNSGVIVVGAHYDTVPGSPGADDNASSVAALLEIARLSRGIKNENTIVFAAFVNEEPPCGGTENMGSMVYAEGLKKGNVPVKVMICLESIGYFSDKEQQQYPIPGMRLFYPRAADFLAIIGNFKSSRYAVSLARMIRKNARIRVRTLVAPDYVAGINRSDHFAFWHNGFKAVVISDTAFYRNKNYHRETDTIDTLDFDSMTQIVKGMRKALKKY